MEPLAMLASRHQSSADAGSRGLLFSSSCEERPAVSWHRSRSRSRHDGREHVVVLPVVMPEGDSVEGIALLRVLKVSAQGLYWPIEDGEPVGPHWEMTFYKTAVTSPRRS